MVSLIDREKGPAVINYIIKGMVEPVKELGEVDMGDYNEFVKYVKFIKETYPAKHYAFVIWNHGSGWKLKEKTSVTKGISYDDSSGNHITNQQLGRALIEAHKILGKKIDLMNFDACLMQMVEVAYVCKDHCDYLVASEETEPGEGAPYADILSQIKPTTTPRQFAKIWASSFSKSYDGGSQGMNDATQSALDCSKFQNLIDAINGFAKTIMSGKYERLMNNSIKKVQMFSTPENIDLKDLIRLVSENSKNDEALKTACEKLNKAIENVVIENGHTGFALENANGIAIYFPWDYMLEKKYKELAFTKDTLWDDMLDSLRTRKTGNEISGGIEKGNLEALKSFLNEAETNKDRKQIQAVIRALNYLVFTENKAPAKVKNEVKSIMEQLKKSLQ